MIRIFITLVLSISVINCAQHSKLEPKQIPNGQWVLADSAFLAEKNQTDNSQGQWQQVFEKSIKSCELAALKAPIQKPICKSSIPVKNCTPSKSFSSSFCGKPIIRRSCDIQSTRQYKDALFAHVRKCMAVTGWQWISSERAEPTIQDIINTIPELVDWQKNDHDKWQLITSIHEKMVDLPEYQNMPSRELLLLVLEKAKQIEQH